MKLWPGLIFVVLGVGMTGTGALAYFALSGPGPGIDEGYYERAVRWDALAAERAASDALGWSVDVVVVDARGAAEGGAGGGADGAVAGGGGGNAHGAALPRDGAWSVEVTLRDAQGRPLEGADVTLEVLALTRPGAAVPLVVSRESGGTYRARGEALPRGLWDVRVLAVVGASRFERTVRVEAERGS